MTAHAKPRLHDIEILDPKSRSVLGYLWVTEDGVFLESQLESLKSDFEALSTYFTQKNHIVGLDHIDRYLVQHTFSPNEAGYLDNLLGSLGSYLGRDRLTGAII